MKKMRVFASIVLVLALLVSVFPSQITAAGTWNSSNSGQSDGYKYVYNNSNRTAKITDYTGSDSSIEIPTEINGYKVVEIGARAFAKSSKLTKVDIPRTIEKIGNSAFASCKKLKSVSIEKGVEYVGAGAFLSCPRLKSVTVPDSVREIGSYAFGYWQDGDNSGTTSMPDFLLKCNVGSEAKKYCDKSETTRTPVKARLSNWNKTPDAVKINNFTESSQQGVFGRASWEKDENASGYVLVFSTDKNFATNVASIQIDGVNNTSTNVLKVFDKKTYYCKVAAYRILEGHKYFGNFSSTKSLTVGD